MDAEMSPTPALYDPQINAASPAADEPIIDRAACIAWLRADCARDHRPAEQLNRRGPVATRRGPLADRRQTTTLDA